MKDAVAACCVLLGVALGGCNLLTSAEEPRILELSFRLERQINEGERHPVASWAVPAKIKLKNRLLQVSGRIEAPDGARLPAEVIVRTTIVNLETGASLKTFRLIVDRSAENGFRKSKKFSKTVAANSLVTVTMEPVGSDLPKGTSLSLCLDAVRKRNELENFPSCAAGNAATTLSGIQVSVFSGRCAVSGCHDSATAEQGLILEPGESFGRLVNVSAVQFPPDRRVRPGDPGRSYLVKKLRGSAPIGGRMPLGGPFLTDAELAGVIEWIENGAADN
ncbi:MAG: hypothetical protein GY769_18055 [bacterium]|nr:hypothetical protein [bacterium]